MHDGLIRFQANLSKFGFIADVGLFEHDTELQRPNVSIPCSMYRYMPDSVSAQIGRSHDVGFSGQMLAHIE